MDSIVHCGLSVKRFNLHKKCRHAFSETYSTLRLSEVSSKISDEELKSIQRQLFIKIRVIKKGNIYKKKPLALVLCLKLMFYCATAYLSLSSLISVCYKLMLHIKHHIQLAFLLPSLR